MGVLDWRVLLWKLHVSIPGDVIIFMAPVRVAQDELVGWQVFFAILFALLLGGLIQFALARGPARGLLEHFGRYVGLMKPHLDAAAQKSTTDQAFV